MIICFSHNDKEIEIRRYIEKPNIKNSFKVLSEEIKEIAAIYKDPVLKSIYFMSETKK